MSLQVIVATMNQTDHSLLDRMNIQSDAIICNQCDRVEFEEFSYKGHNIKWFSFPERGVGLNRNNGLMRATADIVLFADDDVVYFDGYAETIEGYYRENPQADVVVFNLHKKRADGSIQSVVTKEGQASKKDLTRFGTIFISAKREKLHFRNIFFHLQFGGGALYSCGEDTLFLQDCKKKGLHIYITKKTIGAFEQGESTWFNGYTDKFFYDKGIVYYLIDRNLASLFALYHCLKHRKLYREYGWKKAFVQMRKGILKFRRGE